MGYYIRVLSKQAEPVPLAAIRDAIVDDDLSAQVLADDDRDDWEAIALAHPDGDEFVAIERNPVVPGQLGAEELQEFIDEVPNFKPKSAAEWLLSYLPGVKTIYSLQILGAAEKGDGWATIHAVQAALWSAGGGILQADGEGFSNEDGHHILWQFSEGVKGPWQMAVLHEDRSWTAFEMDLGRKDHRSEFLEGRVPKGVSLR